MQLFPLGKGGEGKRTGSRRKHSTLLGGQIWVAYLQDETSTTLFVGLRSQCLMRVVHDWTLARVNAYSVCLLYICSTKWFPAFTRESTSVLFGGAQSHRTRSVTRQQHATCHGSAPGMPKQKLKVCLICHIQIVTLKMVSM